MDKIFVSGMTFVDEYGRERIFSGMNVVDKKEYIADSPEYGYNPETFPFEEFKDIFPFSIVTLPCGNESTMLYKTIKNFASLFTFHFIVER